MKLISNLDANGNHLMSNGVNIGPVRGKNAEGEYDDSGITPMNKGDINFARLQEACLDEVTKKVKPGFTFEDFMTALLRRQNEELTETVETLPTISVTGVLSGDGVVNGKAKDIIMEVGANEKAEYTISNTATRGELTKCMARTYAITEGKSTDSWTDNNDLGCAEGTTSWSEGATAVQGDPMSAVLSASANLTKYAAEQVEVAEESHSLSIGDVTVTVGYGASSRDREQTDGEYVFRSSYGNALYPSVGTIPAGNAVDTTDVAATVTVATKFFCWHNGIAHLLNNSYEAGGSMTSGKEGTVAIHTGDKFILPFDKELTIKWTTSKIDDSAPASTDYTVSVVYIAMPTGATDGVATADLTLLNEAPAAPYKKYKVVEWVSVTEPTNAKIKIQ